MADHESKKKLLIITLSLSEKNGLGRYSLSVIAELKKYYDLLIFTGQEDVPAISGCSIYPLLPPPPVFLKLRHPLIMTACGWKIYARARKEKIELVHSLMDYPHSFLAMVVAKFLGKPLFLTAHGTYSLKPFNWFFDKWLLKFTFKQAVKVFCGSRFTEEEIKKRVKLSNTMVVNNSVDVGRFSPAASEARLPGGPRLLGVGALKARKGFHVSIAALVEVKNKYPDTVYTIVGDQSDSEYFSSLLQIVKDSGLEQNVVFLQNIKDEDLVSCYRQSDLFILTSINIHDSFEGFGLVYLEAGAFKKPAIGTLGCGAEDAIVNGETGYLVEQNDIMGTAEAILKILDDQESAKKMGLAGLELAKRMTWENQVFQYRNQYKKVIWGSRGIFNMLKMILYKIKQDIRQLSVYPAVDLAAHPEVDYDLYWLKKRGDLKSCLSAWQQERAELVLALIEPGSKVLDLGCGEGAVTKVFCASAKRLNVIGADVSEAALAKAEALGIKTIKIDLADIKALSDLPAVDYILGLEILEHLPCPEALINKIKTKAGKGLIFSVPNSGYYIHRLRLLGGRFPLQWLVHPGEHLRFWTVRDCRFWVKALGAKIDALEVHQGIVILNRLWPGLFGQGIIFKISFPDLIDDGSFIETKQANGE